MSAANPVQTTSLFDMVADIQEHMEDDGFSSEVVDAIVTRGLSILFNMNDEER